MLYLSVAIIAIMTFVIGYMIGQDRGLRNAHANIVAQQLVRAKSERPKVPKTNQLRLVKGKITRD